MGWMGGWGAQFYTDPVERLHVADPSHSDRNTEDPNPVWDAPVDFAELTPAYIDDVPEMDWLVTDAPGIVLDMTSDDSHEAASSAITAPNEGAARQAVFAPPVFQAWDERYESRRFQGLDKSPVSDASLRRGLNADPINNPEGFRLGYVDQTFVDRKLYDPERVHDRRLLQPNLPATEVNQPVPEGANSYTSPFTSLARAITTVNQRPQVRRQPPAIDESILSDGTDEGYSSMPDWVAD